MFQDEEEDVYKRDFSAPTLEDHFNKTILPKVMQVSRQSRDHISKSPLCSIFRYCLSLRGSHVHQFQYHDWISTSVVNLPLLTLFHVVTQLHMC